MVFTCSPPVLTKQETLFQGKAENELFLPRTFDLDTVAETVWGEHRGRASCLSSFISLILSPDTQDTSRMPHNGLSLSCQNGFALHLRSCLNRSRCFPKDTELFLSLGTPRKWAPPSTYSHLSFLLAAFPKPGPKSWSQKCVWISTGHVGVNYISTHKVPLANVALARGTAAHPHLSVKNCSPPVNEQLLAEPLQLPRKTRDQPAVQDIGEMHSSPLS